MDIIPKRSKGRFQGCFQIRGLRILFILARVLTGRTSRAVRLVVVGSLDEEGLGKNVVWNHHETLFLSRLLPSGRKMSLPNAVFGMKGSRSVRVKLVLPDVLGGLHGGPTLVIVGGVVASAVKLALETVHTNALEVTRMWTAFILG